MVATAMQQLRLSELISETYSMIIQDTEKRLFKILGPAMLDHEEISGMDQVDFTDDWSRFFRKTARHSVIVAPDGGLAVQHATPQSITSLLSSTLFVLQSYDVHPIIIVQALAQFFHFISCELFNRMLTNKKMLSRSKALQVRMNVSHLEDWISVNRLPNHLLSYLNPSIQLLQLLQCLTMLQDLVDFINTSKKFDALNAPQVKRCVVSYRYEVNEQRIPEEIEKYAMQCAEDTVRHKQHRKQSMDKTRALPLSRTQSQKMTRRQSMSHYLGLNRSVPTTPISEQLPVLHDKPTSQTDEDTDHIDDDENDIKETKDSRFMLPFSIPTTAHMISTSSCHWDKSNEEESHSRQIIPIIPESWMEKLDKQQQQPSSSTSPVTL